LVLSQQLRELITPSAHDFIRHFHWLAFID
jgi:hypothetical protein